MIEAIKQHFDTFPVSSRDQLLRRFYSGRPSAVNRLNEKLRRLVDRNQLEVNREIKPYVYFSVPRRIPLRSAQLTHHLAVVSFYIKLEEFSIEKNIAQPKVIAMEYHFGKGFPRPDIILQWQGRTQFVEIQRTVTSNNRMKTKVAEYEKLVREGKYRDLVKSFDSLWIVGPRKYDVSASFSIEQTVMKL